MSALQWLSRADYLDRPAGKGTPVLTFLSSARHIASALEKNQGNGHSPGFYAAPQMPIGLANRMTSQRLDLERSGR